MSIMTVIIFSIIEIIAILTDLYIYSQPAATQSFTIHHPWVSHGFPTSQGAVVTVWAVAKG
jgi:hypothetical protein